MNLAQIWQETCQLIFCIARFCKKFYQILLRCVFSHSQIGASKRIVNFNHQQKCEVVQSIYTPSAIPGFNKNIYIYLYISVISSFFETLQKLALPLNIINCKKVKQLQIVLFRFVAKFVRILLYKKTFNFWI